MTKKIIILRHGKVDLPYSSHDAMPFEILRKLGTQELDPDSDYDFLIQHKEYLMNIITEYNISSIYHSPSKRCLTLTKYILTLLPGENNVQVSEDKNLKEIFFDMGILYSNNIVNIEKFVLEFVTFIKGKNPGMESEVLILKRINNILEHRIDGENLLMLSHGFLIRYIHSMLSTSSTTGPTKGSWNNSPRFGYLEGIEIDVNTLDVKLIGNDWF